MNAVRVRARFTTKQEGMLVMPLALTATMYAVFHGFGAVWGMPWGWLAGFVVYWSVWCLALPWWVLGGWDGVLDLFRSPTPLPARSRALLYPLLAIPLLLPFWNRFLPAVGEANLTVLLISLALGILIGVTEEILWRGVYIRLFPDNVWLGCIYPAVMFGLWHVAPLSIARSTAPGGTLGFVLYAIFLGLAYGIYAWKTGSIRDTTLAHIAHDTLGLSGFLFVH